MLLKIKYTDNLFHRLQRLESANKKNTIVDDVPYATSEGLKQMTEEERLAAWFDWCVREIMPSYKAHVMQWVYPTKNCRTNSIGES